MTFHPPTNRSHPALLSLLAMLAWCFVCPQIHGAGVITTVDGRNITGEIGIEATGFRVRTGGNAVETIELSRVALVQQDFRDARERIFSRLKGGGLLGTYFDKEDLSGQKVQYLDENIDFEWGESWPVPGVPSDHFSVRWTGQIEVPTNANYSFIANCDEGIRLWIDGELIIDRWAKNHGGEFRGKRSLQSGRKYDFKLEYFDSEYNAMVRLSWEWPGFGRQVIPRECFSLKGGAPAGVERSPTFALRREKGVLLRDGSFVTFTVRELENEEVSFHGGKDFKLPLSQVARIQFRELNPAMAALVQDGRPGVLLGQREFVEGEVKAAGGRRVKVSSVLYGLKTFEAENKSAVVIFRRPVETRTRYELALRNRSTIKTDSLRCEKGNLVVGDGPLMGLKIASWELSELKLTTARLR